MSKVYGYPVWPMSSQPQMGDTANGYIALTTAERKANATYMAWRLYQEGFSYESCVGLLSALNQESRCDACLRERKTNFVYTDDDGLGLYQLTGGADNTTWDRMTQLFTSRGYPLPKSWLSIEQNFKAQMDYVVYRVTEGSWQRPRNVTLWTPYEISRTDLKTATAENAAGALAVMSLHPARVNEIYNSAVGLDPVEDAEAIAEIADELVTYIRSTYASYISTMRSWFTEQDLIRYKPPYAQDGFKWIYYLRPLWWNGRR